MGKITKSESGKSITLCGDGFFVVLKRPSEDGDRVEVPIALVDIPEEENSIVQFPGCCHIASHKLIAEMAQWFSSKVKDEK